MIFILFYFIVGCGVTHVLYKMKKDEIAKWNGGISKKTGEPWNSYDMDSSGCRLYNSGNQHPNGVMEAYFDCSFNVDGNYNDIQTKIHYAGRKGHVLGGKLQRGDTIIALPQKYI